MPVAEDAGFFNPELATTVAGLRSARYRRMVDPREPASLELRLTAVLDRLRGACRFGSEGIGDGYQAPYFPSVIAAEPDCCGNVSDVLKE
jgi:hypothetical protein